MKVLVTAGTQGIGEQIVEYFSPASMGISRRNGYDIMKPEDRRKIARLSLQFDVFVNHAFSRDESQSQLLREVADLWLAQNKEGYIFNTGTYGTYCGQGVDPTYLSTKRMLDEISHDYSRRIEAGGIPFRMTLLRPGMLDTPRSRAKAHWRGNGVRGQSLCQLMAYLYGLPKDMQIPDIVIESIVAR